MGEKKFMVILIQYEERNEQAVDELVKEITTPINTKHGELKRVYQGSDVRIWPRA